MDGSSMPCKGNPMQNDSEMLCRTHECGSVWTVAWMLVVAGVNLATEGIRAAVCNNALSGWTFTRMVCSGET